MTQVSEGNEGRRRRAFFDLRAVVAARRQRLRAKRASASAEGRPAPAEDAPTSEREDPG